MAGSLNSKSLDVLGKFLETSLLPVIPSITETSPRPSSVSRRILRSRSEIDSMRGGRSVRIDGLGTLHYQFSCAVEHAEQLTSTRKAHDYDFASKDAVPKSSGPSANAAGRVLRQRRERMLCLSLLAGLIRSKPGKTPLTGWVTEYIQFRIYCHNEH